MDKAGFVGFIPVRFARNGGIARLLERLVRNEQRGKLQRARAALEKRIHVDGETWPDREAKLFLVTKVENQERIILRFSLEDARICASSTAR